MSESPTPQADTLWSSVAFAGRELRLEYQWLDRAHTNAPLMVFLHEGLGSVSMWRDFPAQLCRALGCRGLVYSRPGYGQSTPWQAHEAWTSDFMHRQALEVLPALLNALGVNEPVWLFGHSDGGSITLIAAAQRPRLVAGAIVLAPHIMVEEISRRTIAQAQEAYLHSGLRGKLARHHADPDSAFWGWSRAWLDPAFENWSLQAELAHITCPLLAVQGLNDDYGTLAQIHGIAESAPHTELLELADCGHSPHRDQAAALTARVQAFYKRHASPAATPQSQ